jgi:hypothetical protein
MGGSGDLTYFLKCDIIIIVNKKRYNEVAKYLKENIDNIIIESEETLGGD